jgi:hypothetical protein
MGNQVYCIPFAIPIPISRRLHWRPTTNQSFSPMMTADRPIVPTPLFSNPRASRGFIPVAASVLALMLGLAGMTNSARAVVVAPGSIMLSSSGWSNSVNFENVLSYDPTTGTFSMPSNAGNAPAPTGWNWTTVSVFNATTDSFQNETGLKQTESDGSTLKVFATGSTDPFLSYSFAVSNPTLTTQTYTFTDGATISPPLSGTLNLFADIGGSVTNVVPGSPAQILPITATVQTLKLSQDGGATYVDAGTDVGPSFTTSTTPGTSLYGVYSSSLSEPAPFAVNYWQLEDQFSLTGNGDTAAFTGFAEITATTSLVPEPATYAAILGALSLGVVVLRRRRQRQLAA